VHVGGKRAYRLARQGTPVEIASKAVRIDRLEITGYDWPRLGLDIVCSSGTFVRAIGRDLAAALGTAAVMESLVRTAGGPFTVERCLPLGQVTPEAAQAALLPAIEAVPDMPRHLLAAEDLDRAVLGGLVSLPADSADALVAVDEVGDLVGILKRHESGRFRLRPNFRGEG
jgi:tRNA pseudouridine55 synthase